MGNNITIKGSHEDLIFKNRDFIQELAKVQELYFDTMVEEMKEDGFDARLLDWLFDYVYNSIEDELFEEYLARYHPWEPTDEKN